MARVLVRVDHVASFHRRSHFAVTRATGVIMV
jgi:hypothetical protein